MNASEWYGEPHILTVHSVRLPAGPLDDGELDYEIQHLPACKQQQRGGGEHSYWEWACELGWYERESGLPFCLKYSGTPITEPGTYQIGSWGRKHYVWDAWAYEYDGGIGVVPAGDGGDQ